jgi:hypothetical protein
MLEFLKIKKLKNFTSIILIFTLFLELNFIYIDFPIVKLIFI